MRLPVAGLGEQAGPAALPTRLPCFYSHRSLSARWAGASYLYPAPRFPATQEAVGFSDSFFWGLQVPVRMGQRNWIPGSHPLWGAARRPSG